MQNQHSFGTPASGLNSPPTNSDRLIGFAQAAQKQVNGALFRCEESQPQDGPFSVVYVVVENDAAHWGEKLKALHREHFGWGGSDSVAPVQLEVLDRATHDAVQRLVAKGLVTRTTRATRALWPPDGSTMSPPLLEAELEKSRAYRSQAARKRRVAAVLADGDLAEEARVALMEAIEPLGHALAVENRLPEPQSLEDALLPPLGAAWKDALPLVRNFMRETSQPVSPVLAALSQV